jgi:hypothetical protein
MENALVSLGNGQYLEILSPAPRPDGTPSRLPSSTRFRTAGWAIHTSDLNELVTQLRGRDQKASDPRPASRRHPDGTVLAWSATNVSGDDLQLAPFFIRWDDGAAHPSATAPAGCRLRALVLTEPAPDQLAALLRLVGVEVTVRAGAPRNLALTLACPRGEVTFTR